MRENLTHAIEDYLKAIYKLQTARGKASTNQLAERLEVAAASVTGMIKKLASTQPPLVEYEKHRGVTLTPEGEKVALEIVRHHRLLELYLHQMLGFSWDKVHEEADRLEHVISEEFEARIAEALGDPRRDPHGDPIPTADLTMPPSSALPLSALNTGERAVIQRVRDSEPELLCYLADRGLVPQSQVFVRERSPFDDNLTVEVSGRELVLGPRVTSQVFVEYVN
jgi:DtxR family Mn-dependent transcriptional regulator